mmetsp:Transcript_92094/g.276355  ORF Transcript_92094/g.276355 Transcript_92094/m.276355 type:complete len:107 (-) Transcript_92094:607-927(-)
MEADQAPVGQQPTQLQLRVPQHQLGFDFSAPVVRQLHATSSIWYGRCTPVVSQSCEVNPRHQYTLQLSAHVTLDRDRAHDAQDERRTGRQRGLPPDCTVSAPQELG